MKKAIATATSILLPSLALAQTTITNVNVLTQKFVDIGNTLIYLLVGLAILYIVFNVVQYFIKGSEEDEKRHKSGMNILWGVVGLFVIVSIWGLVNILVNTFRTTPTNQPIPNLGNSTDKGGGPFNQVPVVR